MSLVGELVVLITDMSSLSELKFCCDCDVETAAALWLVFIDCCSDVGLDVITT